MQRTWGKENRGILLRLDPAPRRLSPIQRFAVRADARRYRGAPCWSRTAEPTQIAAKPEGVYFHPMSVWRESEWGKHWEERDVPTLQARGSSRAELQGVSSESFTCGRNSSGCRAETRGGTVGVSPSALIGADVRLQESLLRSSWRLASPFCFFLHLCSL